MLPDLKLAIPFAVSVSVPLILSSAHSACALQLLQPKFSEPLILLLSLSHFIIENSTGFSSSNNDQHPTAPPPPTHHHCGHRPGALRCYYLSPVVLQPPCLYLCPPEHPVLSPDTSWRHLFMTHDRPLLHTLPVHSQEKPCLGNSLQIVNGGCRCTQLPRLPSASRLTAPLILICIFAGLARVCGPLYAPFSLPFKGLFCRHPLSTSCLSTSQLLLNVLYPQFPSHPTCRLPLCLDIPGVVCISLSFLYLSLSPASSNYNEIFHSL